MQWPEQLPHHEQSIRAVVDHVACWGPRVCAVGDHVLLELKKKQAKESLELTQQELVVKASHLLYVRMSSAVPNYIPASFINVNVVSFTCTGGDWEKQSVPRCSAWRNPAGLGAIGRTVVAL